MIQLLLVPLRIAGGMRIASSIGGNRDQKLRGDIQLGMKTNSKELSKKLGKFQSKLSRSIDKGVRQAGFQLLEIIKTKTKKGLDFKNDPFAAYSEGYRKRLQREKRPLKVDLHYDGDMLRSLTPNSTIKKTGRHQVSLAFSNAEQRKKALFNQVMMGSKNRVFFKFNKRTEEIINKSFKKFIKKELRL